ncbi:transposase [Desulfococcaceae bacterium HSG9]|nr:transposase [Desulfococcaceae bacterium HSG9]
MNNSTAAHKDITPGFTYPQPKDEISIGDIGDKSLLLNFDGGDISSDAGALPLLKVEERIGLIKAVAGVIPDCRDVRYIRHTLTDRSPADTKTRTTVTACVMTRYLKHSRAAILKSATPFRVSRL